MSLRPLFLQQMQGSTNQQNQSTDLGVTKTTKDPLRLLLQKLYQHKGMAKSYSIWLHKEAQIGINNNDNE